MSGSLGSGRNKSKALRTLVFVLTSLLLSGCGGGRPEFGSGPTPCFEALPVAKNALIEPKPFVGVRLTTGSSINKQFDMGVPSSMKHVCLVAFKNSQTINRSTNQRYTLVAVSLKTKEVLATKVVPKLPSSFRHTLSLS